MLLILLVYQPPALSLPNPDPRGGQPLFDGLGIASAREKWPFQHVDHAHRAPAPVRRVIAYSDKQTLLVSSIPSTIPA